jgi:hypothetical protein
MMGSFSNGDNLAGNTNDPKRKNVDARDHSRDAVATTMYLDDGKNFNILEAVRVASHEPATRVYRYSVMPEYSC